MIKNYPKKFPWQNPKCTKRHLEEVWKIAHILYNQWLEFNKCGSKKLQSYFLISSDLMTIVNMFNNGWIPQEDFNWLSTFDVKHTLQKIETTHEQFIETTKNYTPKQIATKIELSKVKEYIFNNTKFLDGNYDVPYRINTRIYCLLNNITEIPKCRCGNLCVSDRKSSGIGNGFSKTCSEKCSRTTSKMGDSEEKLKNYDWMYEEYINKKLSQAQIARDLNVSENTVFRCLKMLSIEREDYKTFLNDKEWFYKQYKEEKLTYKAIAKNLGISHQTVSVYVKQHKIELNPTNSYERPRKMSKGQMEMIEYINTLYDYDILPNASDVIPKYEIDIYLPDINLGFEYNGIFYHAYQPEETSEGARKGQFYHYNKTKLCKEKDIKLFQFWDVQWKRKQDIVKSMIAARLNVFEEKIQARKCIVKEITTKEKGEFLDINHIQGTDKSKVKLGLFLENRLVSVMTFSYPRNRDRYDWELSRFCSLLNTNVIGGFSKLLSYFRKNYTGSIVSFADLMYSDGKLYETNGFKLSHQNKPTYHYIDLNKFTMHHKSNFRKANLGDIQCSEWEHMKKLGYRKIFDCGNLAYVLE